MINITHGAKVRYCGHAGYFIADIYWINGAAIVRASRDVSPEDIIRTNLEECTHHIVDFPNPGFWRPQIGVFAVPATQCRVLNVGPDEQLMAVVPQSVNQLSGTLEDIFGERMIHIDGIRKIALAAKETSGDSVLVHRYQGIGKTEEEAVAALWNKLVAFFAKNGSSTGTLFVRDLFLEPRHDLVRQKYWYIAVIRMAWAELTVVRNATHTDTNAETTPQNPYDGEDDDTGIIAPGVPEPPSSSSDACAA